MEPFVVRHYSEDEGPTIKGNGFDGLRVGDDREESQAFVDFVNALLDERDALKRENEILKRGVQVETELFAKLTLARTALRSLVAEAMHFAVMDRAVKDASIVLSQVEAK